MRKESGKRTPAIQRPVHAMPPLCVHGCEVCVLGVLHARLMVVRMERMEAERDEDAASWPRFGRSLVVFGDIVIW